MRLFELHTDRACSIGKQRRKEKEKENYSGDLNVSQYSLTTSNSAVYTIDRHLSTPLRNLDCLMSREDHKNSQGPDRELCVLGNTKR